MSKIEDVCYLMQQEDRIQTWQSVRASDVWEMVKEDRELREKLDDYALIIEQFQKLLGVYTTTEALSKVAVLMREDDTADKLLSKALGHLHSCSEAGSVELYKEIATAFGRDA